MTQPRLVVPGDTLMITRRTLRRHHLFRPDSAIRQLYLYTLAPCARQFGILVHAITLMSTHEHLIVTDTQGRHPEFLRRLHRLVSMGTKVLRKWAVKRPKAYFRADNRQWPESIDLSLTLPPSLQRRYGADALRKAVQLELERQERLAHQEVRARLAGARCRTRTSALPVSTRDEL